MRYLLFGTGDCYERYKRWFKDYEIIALIDNSPEKQGKEIDGHKVLSPEDGINFEFDAVIILSFYVKAMKMQLIGLGVAENVIYHFYDLHKLIDVKKNSKKIMKFGRFSFEGKRKKILLLNQNLTVGGPAFTLFDTARILKKNGYHVVYGSMVDGPLRDMLLAENIPVIVDENLLVGTMKASEWVSEYDLVFCNAINFYVFLSDRDISIPMIWWLHDSEFFYEGVDKQVISQISEDNLCVYTVGRVPENILKEYAPKLKMDSLLYGIKERKITDKEFQNKKMLIRFVTIGFVESRKGQDILVEAIQLLPRIVRAQCKFYIVGKDLSVFAKSLEEKAKDIPEITFTGMVADVHEYLDKADVLICPSREDPMPAVCTEAMMHKLPCIVSDSTGTAVYIKEKENGLIFQNENVNELARQIKWCVKNRQRLSVMGKESEKIYKNNFSMQIFERNLLNAVEDMISEGDE